MPALSSLETKLFQHLMAWRLRGSSFHKAAISVATLSCDKLGSFVVYLLPVSRRKASKACCAEFLQLPAPTSWVRFCDERAAQARMVAITLNGFAPWSRAVSIVVRTSASASAAHMAR